MMEEYKLGDKVTYSDKVLNESFPKKSRDFYSNMVYEVVRVDKIMSDVKLTLHGGTFILGSECKKLPRDTPNRS